MRPCARALGLRPPADGGPPPRGRLAGRAQAALAGGLGRGRRSGLFHDRFEEERRGRPRGGRPRGVCANHGRRHVRGPGESPH
eukprot:3790767-Pyramimonas_sp.AAC.1